MRRCLFLGLLLVPTLVLAQKITLESYVAAQRQVLVGDAPLIYLDGKRVTSKLNSLPGFDRKITTHGSLKAIVPISMVQIDDSFSQKPDLYDGLDPRSKVLYFVSTLTENQIKIATSNGIGLGDLNAQQKPILNSIIPKRLTVERREADEKDNKAVDKFTLTDDQRLKVKLKLTKTISLDLPLVDGKGYCPAGSMDHTALWNSSGFFQVEENMESGPDQIFGVKVRSIVPNKLKPSDINYGDSSLSVPIKFDSPVTLTEAFAEVRKLTRVAIYADPRVASRKLTFIGKPVKTGELLSAIAESVTGTYRRVGTDFVLTSDLMGLGTRKVKFDQWEADVRDYVRTLTSTWYKQIATSNVLKFVKTSPSDPIQPDSRMEEYLAKRDQNGPRATMPDDLIDAGIRGIVTRFNDMYKTQPVTTKGISAANDLSYCLMMPNGQEILNNGQGTLGSFVLFNQELKPRGQNDYGLPKANRQIPEGASVGLILRLSNKGEVDRLFPLVHNYGFNEVLLDTDSSEALNGALALAKTLGMQVRLAIRPWLNTDPNQESDQTVMGDNGKTLREWLPKNARLSPPVRGYDFMRMKMLPEGSVSPDTRPERWHALRALTQIKGLAGIVVLDAQPAGYEPKIGEGYSYLNSPSDLVSWTFGYSTSMRSAFLRQYSVDPIDLVPKGLMSSVNVSPYFFPDMELMGMPRTYGSSDGDEYIIDPYVGNWFTFRAKIMAEALKRVTGSLLKDVQVPIWADMLPGANNKAVSTQIPLMAFTKDQEFQFDQSGPGSPFGAGVQNAAAFRIVIDGQSENDLMTLMSLFTMAFGRKPGISMNFDLSRLGEEGATKFLAKWFDPKK